MLTEPLVITRFHCTVQKADHLDFAVFTCSDSAGQQVMRVVLLLVVVVVVVVDTKFQKLA